MSAPLLDGNSFATAKVRPRRVSPVWLIPILALGVIAYLIVTTASKRGPVITLTFSTAEGLSAQQTLVKHKAVSLGTVEDIRLSDDTRYVVVHVRMEVSARRVLTDRARFWVVRPRLTPAAISGLETLVSGAYIEVDPGAPGGREQHAFRGLEEPPSTRSDEAGHSYILTAQSLGSLNPGAPVFFRDVNAGEVLSFDLGNGEGPLTIRIFVRAPYDTFVHPDSRFWSVGGITATAGASGLRLELQSVQAALSGGVAFQTPTRSLRGLPSASESAFRLYASRAEAEADLFGPGVACVSYFQSSVQSLGAGSPVQLLGVQIGTVTSVRLVETGTPLRLAARVAFNLQASRLEDEGSAISAAPAAAVVSSLVLKGARVTLESSNYLTGQKMLSLESSPGSGDTSIAREGDALLLPSRSGGLDNIVSSMSDAASKVDAIPFEEIGRNLNIALQAVSATVGSPTLQKAIASLSGTLGEAQRLMEQAHQGLAPALARLPDMSDQLQQAIQKANTALGEGGYGQNSDFQRGMERLVHQVDDAARTIRLLADFLDRHPESLIRGRSNQASER